MGGTSSWTVGVSFGSSLPVPKKRGSNACALEDDTQVWRKTPLHLQNIPKGSKYPHNPLSSRWCPLLFQKQRPNSKSAQSSYTFKTVNVVFLVPGYSAASREFSCEFKEDRRKWAPGSGSPVTRSYLWHNYGKICTNDLIYWLCSKWRG